MANDDDERKTKKKIRKAYSHEAKMRALRLARIAASWESAKATLADEIIIANRLFTRSGLDYQYRFEEYFPDLLSEPARHVAAGTLVLRVFSIVPDKHLVVCDIAVKGDAIIECTYQIPNLSKFATRSSTNLSVHQTTAADWRDMLSMLLEAAFPLRV